jgi:hypothetical protein
MGLHLGEVGHRAANYFHVPFSTSAIDETDIPLRGFTLSEMSIDRCSRRL